MPPTIFRRLRKKQPNRSWTFPSEKSTQLGKSAVAKGGVVTKQPVQPASVDPPPIDKALEVPDHVLRELREVLRKPQRPNGRLFDITSELGAKLASYAEVKSTEYDDLREQGTRHEGSLAFDFACARNATPLEIEADEVFQRLKKDDITRFYDTAPKRRGHNGQEHPRFFGDHFLSNADLIEKTQLYALCRAMPKGAHLHIHFNANLLPGVLLGIARDMPRMFIWSNIPLDRDDAFGLCRIQFSIMNEQAVADKGAGSPFESEYQGGSVMQFREFRKAFPGGEEAADRWLESKLIFHEEEAHNLLQTSDGAWEKFNARTQMMKGLFNYETAYTRYTRQCLEEFVDDNIQYAEIRPNFMFSNQVWKDDGSSRIDNIGIMNLIIDEYEAFQKDHHRQVLKGLKVIYCTPRSFSEKQVGEALMQCFQFKMDSKFAPYIAGFDLVGEESKGKPLKAFRAQFLEFRALCQAAGVDVPFLFHCGETLDVGGDTDGNLMDALLLGAKRIGHGFALPRHPYVMDRMKQRGVCVEVCPISNEILGLTPRIGGHAVYSLLANNVPCTISTDNGTLFRSRLSHDFYQTIAGKPDMTLHGLRQLAEWSIEHACMEPGPAREEVREGWERMWEAFCRRVARGEFGGGTEEEEKDGVVVASTE